MAYLKLATATRHFSQPLRQSLETAAAIGAQGVQLDVRNEVRPQEFSDTGRRHLRIQLEEQRLELATFEYPMRRALHDQDALDARIAGLKGALEFAWQMKVPVLTGRIGRIPDDAESPKYQLLVDVLNEIARHSNRVGATFAITPGVDSSEQLEALFNRVTAGPLGLNLDPAGLIMSGGDPVETYRALHSRVLSVQIRDGLRDVDGQGIEVPVGRGEVVWDELLALLEEGAYRGWLITTRSTGDDRIGDMSRAIKFVKNVAAGWQ